MNKIEYRSTFELDEEKRVISGYAAVFEKPSKWIGWTETIKSGAITQELVDSSDIILNYNHDDEKILGRSVNGKGTLKCTVDEIGLRFECEVPNTTLGNDVYESIKRGDLFECSFAFALNPEDSAVDRWYKGEDGELYRDINSIFMLFDCAICPHGAYGDTSVIARNQEQAEKELQKLNEEERERVKQNMFCELNKKLKNTLNYV